MRFTSFRRIEGFFDLKKTGKEKYLIVEWQEYMR